MVARNILCAVAVALLGLCASVALGAEPGLVAHFRFDEGEGPVAEDGSGQGHDGTIHGAGYVQRGDGFALRLDGENDYVEIAPTADFAGRNEGAFELWFRPSSWQGGLVDWSASGSWKDIRLTLAFNTYHRQEQDAIFLVNLADGEGSRHGQLPRPAKSTWTHLAVSFRGGQATIYGDGQVLAVFSGFAPKREGLPLWIGRCQGLGRDFFAGEIDEVRVYSRALMHDDVLTHYKATAAALGKDTTHFDKPKVQANALPEPGWVVVTADCGLMRPLPDGAVLEAGVGKPGKGRWQVTGQTPLDLARHRQRVKLDVGKLPADEFGNSEDYCAAYAQAIRKLAATPEYKDRAFYPYANHLYTGPEGIELIEDKCFNHVGHNCYSHAHGPYSTEHWAWFNYIWRVFRAKAPTAKVSVMDWKSPSEPGGRIGQKLIYNFAHVQPYFPEGPR
ncbi:MAG: LamG domain-containing protein [Planctomycetota bacterium]